MESVFRRCVWCGKEYFPEDKRQKYCSPECRERAKNFNRVREYKRPPRGGRVCTRDDCKMFKINIANHCNGLTEVPADTSLCKFFKEKV